MAASALLAVLTTACGGKTGGLPPVNPAGGQLVSSDTIAQSTIASTPMLTSGSVTGVLTGGFVVNTGSPHGRIAVYTNSSTQFTGAKPYVGENLYANGSGSWTTSIQASNVVQSSALMQASGTVAGLITGGFTLRTGTAHGSIHVYTTPNTVKNATIAVGATVNVIGGGSWSTSIGAMSVASTSTAAVTPSPAPAATASALPPNGTSTTTLIPQATKGNGLLQVFDAWGTPRITSSAAVTDGHRYGIVWGARPGMAPYWIQGNTSIVATYYLPMETDANTSLWGAIGHSLTWWQTNHPDWILYACTSSGTPTTLPAMISDLPDNVPLDIHNPSVVAYQIKLAANYAIANGYNGLAIDEVLFDDIGGSNVGTGAYGCGIRSNGTFVRRYSGSRDAAWTADVVAWVKLAHSILTTDATLAPHHLKLVVNHPAGNISNANEQAILSNVDADLDETGYSDYGNYAKSSSLFKITTDWARYAQAHGAAPVIVNKFAGTSAVTSTEVEYSIATYLMSNEGGAAVWTSNANGYGVEQYFSQYATNFGTRCGGYYGGPTYSTTSPDIWYRKYSNALVVVNSGSATLASEIAKLPSGHTYTDLMGRPISSSLAVAKSGAYVLLTTNGCT